MDQPLHEKLHDYVKNQSKGTMELLHTMENFLLVVDFCGNVVMASESIFKNTELQRKGLYGKRIYDFIEKTDKSPLDFFDLLLLNSQARNMELMIRESNLVDIPALMISSSILKDFYNGEDYILLLLADIREHKQNQIQLMHSNKMVSLGEMATNIAHEINNPLAIIDGQLLMLEKSLAKLDCDNSKQLEIATKVRKNFKRIEKIIKSLRMISRNNEKVPLEVHSLTSIFEGVQNLSEQRLKMKEIGCWIEGFKRSDKVLCNETEMTQVFLNLINNAIDSIENLENKWIKIIIERDEENYIINVRDSGSGIDLNNQIRLFEPFYTTKDIGKGTGLGLSISRGIIESHGGNLSYESSCSNTCFKIELPIYRQND